MVHRTVPTLVETSMQPLGPGCRLALILSRKHDSVDALLTGGASLRQIAALRRVGLRTVRRMKATMSC